MSAGDQALLVSPTFQVGSLSSVCVTIWYHMWGSNIGTLTISAVRLFSNGQASPIVLKVYQGNILEIFSEEQILNICFKIVSNIVIVFHIRNPDDFLAKTHISYQVLKYKVKKIKI